MYCLMQRKPPKGKVPAQDASGSGASKPVAATQPSVDASQNDVAASQVSMVVNGTQPSVDASQNSIAASQPSDDAPGDVAAT
jgi:hypothetical protein